MTWETVRLGDVAEQIRGVTYSKGEAIDTPTSGYVALVRAGNIGEAGLHMDDLIHVPATRVSPRQWLRVDDVVVASSSGSLSVVGKAARVVGSIDATFGAFCKVLRPFSGIDAGYFAHYFRTAEYRRYISSVAAGANINNLRNEDLDRIEIPLPPLPEQRRIAAILDEADALRARAARAADTMFGLRAANFRRAVAQVTRSVPLDTVTHMYGGASLPGGEAFTGQAGGYLLLRVSDMNLPGNEVEINYGRDWRRERGARASTAPAGSVVLPKRGASIATNKKRLLKRPALLDPNLMAVQGEEGVLHGDWLHAWFDAFDLQSVQSGSSVPQLNKKDLAPLQIPLPDWSEQLRFSERVVAAGDLLDRAGGQAQHLDELFASLQHRAYRGEL